MKIKDILLGIIFSVVGIAIICAGLFFRSLTNEFEENSEATTATIIRIDEDYHGDSKDHKVYVEFEVDGIRYSGKLDLYHSGMKEFIVSTPTLKDYHCLVAKLYLTLL